MLLGRRQGKLIFTPRGKTTISLSLTYLGLKEVYPQFRLNLQLEGNTHRLEVEVKQTSWQVLTTLADFMPNLPLDTSHLTLKVVAASADIVRVQLVTNMKLRYEGKWDMLGFDFLEMADIAETPDAAFVSWLAGREEASVEEAAHFLSQTEQATQTLLDRLVEQGVLLETREQGRPSYHVHFAARRKRRTFAPRRRSESARTLLRSNSWNSHWRRSRILRHRGLSGRGRGCRRHLTGSAVGCIS